MSDKEKEKEKKFRARIVKMLEPIGAFPVENVVHDGVPDVCCVAGWIELKVAVRPRSPGSRVVVDLRPAQRLWLRKWRVNGGRAWTLTLLGDTLLLHEGHWSAECLGHSTEEVLRAAALKVWDSRPTGLELMRALAEPLPRIN